MNGYISLGKKIDIVNPYMNNFFPEGQPILAVYWTDIDTSAGTGALFVDHINNFTSSYGEQIHKRIKELIPLFEPEEIIIATWENVSPFPISLYQNQMATFQLILATNYIKSYSIFNFKKDSMLWSKTSQDRRFTIGVSDGQENSIGFEIDYYRADSFSNISKCYLFPSSDLIFLHFVSLTDKKGTFLVNLGNITRKINNCDNLKTATITSLPCPCTRILIENDKQFKSVNDSCFDSQFSENDFVQRCCYEKYDLVEILIQQ